jgi:micrococcal nuclease
MAYRDHEAGAAAGAEGRQKNFVARLLEQWVPSPGKASMNARWISLCVCLFLLVACRSDKASQGRVLSIHDGDSLRLAMNDGSLVEVRLNGIDAPELAQPFGIASRDFLREMAEDKPVRLESHGKDRYERTLGVVHLDGGESLNQAQLRAGLAWHFKRYSSDTTLADLESDARARGAGLWSEKDPVPPWDFRARGKARSERDATVSDAEHSETEGDVRGNLRSKRYHLPHCKDYEQISPKNRVSFSTEADAIAAGFSKAGNCD